eukprot:5890476-Alexandrium_andersonii.AAC.1
MKKDCLAGSSKVSAEQSAKELGGSGVGGGSVNKGGLLPKTAMGQFEEAQMKLQGVLKETTKIYDALKSASQVSGAHSMSSIPSLLTELKGCLKAVNQKVGICSSIWRCEELPDGIKLTVGAAKM